MDTQRLLLLIALSFVLLLMWQQWQIDYVHPPADSQTGLAQKPTGTAAGAPEGAPESADVPQATPSLPTTASPGDNVGVPEAGIPTAPTTSALASDRRLRVETDVFTAEIDTYGGDLRRVSLKDYPVSIEEPNVPFQLMNDTLPDLFVAQSGLLASQGTGPTHHATFSSTQDEFVLADGADELDVRLDWTSDTGVTVTKRYVFQRGSHLVRVLHEVSNSSAEDWAGAQYRQLQRTQVAEDGNAFVYTYLGGAIFTPEDKYEKIDFAEMVDQDLSRNSAEGWAAMLQHYFLGAWIPDPVEVNHYYTKVLPGQRHLLGAVSPEQTAPAGGDAVFETRLYVGPKIQPVLAGIAPGLDLTVDYGILTVIAQPLFWLLTKIHDLLGNWGWSILGVTLLIKLVFYKLSETSYRSMANMRRMQPRMQALKERFGDDKQKMNQALMELYKKEKINPLGGCLPIAVQIPVFIALYWVLLESVELRQAPFMFWIEDLSIKDPFYILPLIMGVTMFLQQRLNPAPMDPIQQKVMMALPVVFTVFFAFFPAGLVLYWVANNVLSIAQQWVITKRIEEAAQHKN